jgi:2-polyprenyl-6-methoxyphenol hydroxylase-like FAD-dependent oxidoreductase
VGDASMTLDPITGQGIGNALVDAERLAIAVDLGFSGRSSLNSALADYERDRNKDTLLMYEFTADRASFVPPTMEQEMLFSAMAKKPEAANYFFGALTGSVRLSEFFSASNLLRTLGITGMGRLMMSKVKSMRR